MSNTLTTILDPKPGNRTLRDPSASPEELHALFLRERAEGEWVTYTAENMVKLFCDAYAEEVAWRKGRSISAEEVARVAAREQVPA